MKKNLYYRTVYKKKNSLIDAFVGFFSALAFFPRILLEVFIRKNFGERYFRLSGPIIMIFILFWLPWMKELTASSSYFGGGSRDFSDAFLKHITWYIFLGGFLYMCIKRKSEITISKNKYDFSKFSLYDGDLHPSIKKYGLQKEIEDGIEIERVNLRKVETLLEPAIFFIIGIILILCTQLVGFLILISSIFYSLSYIADWRSGDDYVLDMIDEIIAMKNFEKSFVDDADPSETDNFRTRASKPKGKDRRQSVADATNIDDEENPTFAL